METITVQTLSNGQREVRKGNLVLTQTIWETPRQIKRFNDCAIHHADGVEMVCDSDERFKDLFIALSQSK